MNWLNKLVAWERDMLGRPFEWGATDCGSLVRDMCSVIYGDDVFERAPSYTTRIGALRALSKTGGVEQAVRDIGATEVSINFIQDSDIVIMDDPDHRYHNSYIYINGYLLVAEEASDIYRVKLHDLDLDDPVVLRLP